MTMKSRDCSEVESAKVPTAGREKPSDCRKVRWRAVCRMMDLARECSRVQYPVQGSAVTRSLADEVRRRWAWQWPAAVDLCWSR